MRVDPATFEALYARTDDPWSFATSDYELGRYRATLDLIGASYQRAFEPGCSYRHRLEEWFAHHGEMPDRIVEISSYHAMLGCAVAGMGISLLRKRGIPALVLSTEFNPVVSARCGKLSLATQQGLETRRSPCQGLRPGTDLTCATLMWATTPTIWNA